MNPIKFKNVWLCDDDADDHYLFEEALRQAVPDAVLTIFGDGHELLSRLHMQRPDILFLDINMPNINGLETLSKIRYTSGLTDLPVVIYSVSEQKSDITTAYNYGAVLYLVKPQLYQDVVSQLNAVFQMDWTKADPTASYQNN